MESAPGGRFVIFHSWQSDSPDDTNRGAIRRSLRAAANVVLIRVSQIYPLRCAMRCSSLGHQRRRSFAVSLPRFLREKPLP